MLVVSFNWAAVAKMRNSQGRDTLIIMILLNQGCGENLLENSDSCYVYIKQIEDSKF